MPSSPTSVCERLSRRRLSARPSRATRSASVTRVWSRRIVSELPTATAAACWAKLRSRGSTVSPVSTRFVHDEARNSSNSSAASRPSLAAAFRTRHFIARDSRGPRLSYCHHVAAPRAVLRGIAGVASLVARLAGDAQPRVGKRLQPLAGDRPSALGTSRAMPQASSSASSSSASRQSNPACEHSGQISLGAAVRNSSPTRSGSGAASRRAIFARASHVSDSLGPQVVIHEQAGQASSTRWAMRYVHEIGGNGDGGASALAGGGLQDSSLYSWHGCLLKRPIAFTYPHSSCSNLESRHHANATTDDVGLDAGRAGRRGGGAGGPGSGFLRRQHAGPHAAHAVRRQRRNVVDEAAVSRADPRAPRRSAFRRSSSGPTQGKDIDAIAKLCDELKLDDRAVHRLGLRARHERPQEPRQVRRRRSTKPASVAKRLDCPKMCVVGGNDQPGMTQEQMHENIITGLKRVAPIAEEHQVMLILEPMNIRVDHKGHCLYGSPAAVRICREVNSHDREDQLGPVPHADQRRRPVRPSQGRLRPGRLLATGRPSRPPRARHRRDALQPRCCGKRTNWAIAATSAWSVRRRPRNWPPPERWQPRIDGKERREAAAEERISPAAARRGVERRLRPASYLQPPAYGLQPGSPAIESQSSGWPVDPRQSTAMASGYFCAAPVLKTTTRSSG